MDESLLGDFISETQDLLQEMETSILRLEENRNDIELVSDIFRSIHTIKGSSEYLGMANIAEIAHKLEYLLDLIRQEKYRTDGRIIQLLMDVRDRIGLMLKEVEDTPAEETAIEDLVSEIESLMVPVDVASKVSLLGGEAENGEKSIDGILLDSDSGELAAAFSDEDEELFSIFMEQFKGAFLKLKSEVRRLSAAANNNGNAFSGCIECISSLRSSANYMGYDQLCQLYDQWVDKITSFESVLKSGGPDRMQKFVKEGVQPTANKLAGIFPEKYIDFSFDIEIPSEIDTTGNTLDFHLDDEDAIGPGLFEDLASEIKGHGQGDTSVDSFDDEELSLFDDFLSEPDQETDASTGLQFSDRALLEDFIDEAEEHLNVIEISLLSMLNDQVTDELIDNTFRSIHTIKGSAEYLGLKKAAELLHKMENILDLMRYGKYTPGRETIETLIEAKDITQKLVEACMDSAALEGIRIHDMLDRLADLLDQPEAVAHVPSQTDAGVTCFDTDRGEAASVKGGSGQAAIVTLVNEDFHEDYDKELYTIFLEQFDTDLNAVREEIAADTRDHSMHDVLQRCLSHISRLRSSANYMGYVKLLNLYDLWRSEIETFMAGEAINNKAIAAEFLPSSMRPWVEEIWSIFNPSESKAASDDDLYGVAKDSGDSGISAGRFMPMENIPGGCALESVAEAEPLDLGVGTPSEPADDPMELSLFSEVALDSDEKDLFKKLESAFNSSMPQSNKVKAVGEDAQAVPDLFSNDEIPDMALPTAKDLSPFLGDDPSDDIPDVFQDMRDEILRLHLERGIDPLAELYSAYGQEMDGVDEGEEQLVAPGQELDIDGPVVTDVVPDETAAAPQEKAVKHNIRVDASKIDLLMNQVGELVVNRSVFTQLTNELRNLQHYFKQNFNLDKKEIKPIKDLEFKLSEATVFLGRVANELQEGVMKVRMLPISQLFNRYPRLVHDLTRNSDKRVRLDVKGAETELDRMVIEEISDPLIHVIRNAVDHGIEAMSARKEIGKPEAGTISLDAYHESNHIIIEIVDDGKGLDLTKITEKAIQTGIISEGDAVEMTSAQLSELITIPGFSTADEITHTSGRGVGMDVVKKNIESLHGTLEIDSVPGKGTKFRIKIPLTLAIISALLVRVGDELYTIPLSLVEKNIRIQEEDITVIEGVEVIHLRNEPISLLSLPKLFKKRNQVQNDSGRLYVVIVNNGKTQVGLIVDELIGQEEVVIKPLEDYLQENSGFSGATILGDGRISLILDVHELVKITLDRKAKIAAESVI